MVCINKCLEKTTNGYSLRGKNSKFKKAVDGLIEILQTGVSNVEGTHFRVIYAHINGIAIEIEVERIKRKIL